MQRRSTASQTAVRSLFNEGRALSPELIRQRLAGRDINPSTIYRILHRFVEDGVLHRFVGADGRQYFAACQDCDDTTHHHDHLHFRCLSCERVECLPEPLEYRLPSGYRAESMNASVAGYCADCTPG